MLGRDILNEAQLVPGFELMVLLLIQPHQLSLFQAIYKILTPEGALFFLCVKSFFLYFIVLLFGHICRNLREKEGRPNYVLVCHPQMEMRNVSNPLDQGGKVLKTFTISKM